METTRRRVALLLLALLVLLSDGTPAQESRQPGPPSAKTIRIAGRCLDSDKKPIPKAKVYLYCQDYKIQRIRLVQSGITDEQGKFAFDGVRNIPPEDFGLMHYLVIAQAPKHAVGGAKIRSESIPMEALDIRMGKPATVSGQITDEGGSPVPSANVWLMGFSFRGRADTLPSYNGFFLSNPIVLLRTKSDAKGLFRMTDLPTAVEVMLRVDHPRFAMQRVRVTAPASQDVVLEPGGVVTGRVVYADGKPGAGVFVQAQGTTRHGGASVKADADGRYRLESLQPDAYNIWARAEGWTVKAHDSFDVGARDAEKAPDLVLVRGGFITGKVIDRITGKPVQPGKASDVGLYGPSRPRSGAAIEAVPIQPDGTFKIRAAPGANYVYLRGRPPWPTVTQGQNAEVKEGKIVVVQFVVAKQPKPPR